MIMRIYNTSQEIVMEKTVSDNNYNLNLNYELRTDQDTGTETQMTTGSFELRDIQLSGGDINTLISYMTKKDIAMFGIYEIDSETGAETNIAEMSFLFFSRPQIRINGQRLFFNSPIELTSEKLAQFESWKTQTGLN